MDERVSAKSIQAQVI